MSELGWIGRDFRVVLDGKVIAAVRAKRASMAAVPIDTTEGEKDGYRHLDSKADTYSLELTVEGVSTVDNFDTLRALFYADDFADVQLVHATGDVQRATDGAFLLSLTHEGEHLGIVQFSAVFSFSGPAFIVPPVVLTSKPYPLLAEDDVAHAFGVRSVRYAPVQTDDVVHAFGITGGLIAEPTVTYEDWPPDELDHGFAIVGGEIFQPVATYEDWPPDELEHAFAPTGGAIFDPVVRYEGWPTEELTHSFAITGGSLT